MKNITTQFELFENESRKLYKATIEASTSNPDWELGFTVYGIGRDKREAAIFALATGWMVFTGEITDSDSMGEKLVNDLNVAISFIESYTNLEEDVTSLMNDDFDGDYFSDHGTDSSVYLEWGEIENTMSDQSSKGASMLRRFGKPSPIDQIGGYVIDISSKEISYDEDEDDDY
jgi:hypothetical protein